jgi:hypothetical protein
VTFHQQASRYVHVVHTVGARFFGLDRRGIPGGTDDRAVGGRYFAVGQDSVDSDSANHAHTASHAAEPVERVVEHSHASSAVSAGRGDLL